ncbi:hypothetical protein ARMGADRAFT_1035947 [Armillaria gallica]|uniref:Uncharacterized protein n=1 Tax=Armillaria gallica TaxID=47427 RepID=A0A2H3DEQ7_ARMGA|nr:hypothetical protein ARMGADRAFT_1035947 [Armillaria gallica]
MSHLGYWQGFARVAMSMLINRDDGGKQSDISNFCLIKFGSHSPIRHPKLVPNVKAHDSSDLKAQLKLDDLLADAEYLEMFILGQLKIDFHASVAFLSAEPQNYQYDGELL